MRSIESARHQAGPRAGAIAALDHVHERWDGLGIPGKASGERLSLTVRVMHLATQAVIADRAGGERAALAVVGHRAGGHLDPELVALVLADPQPLLAAVADEIVASDYVSHGPQAPPAEGPEGVKARIAVYQDALDGYWDVQEIHAGGDRVVVRWIGRGTHTGELMSVPATGATVAVDAITIFRIAACKIAEEWTVSDALGLLQQVGAVPATASPTPA